MRTRRMRYLKGIKMNSKHFTVYSKPACPACVEAKNILTSKGLPFTEISLDVGQPKSADKFYISREDLMVLFPEARTVPQISLYEDHEVFNIGDISNLKEFLSNACV